MPNYKSFKATLEEEYNFPTRYIFKFIVKTGSKEKIFEKMNSFDKELTFTEEPIKNNKLIFLDVCLYVESGKLQMKQHRKSAAVVYNNFQKAVMPKSQKIATLTGEIFRAKYCSSTENNFNEALSNLESIFLKNQYPKKLILNKISEVKNRNFSSKADKTEKNNEIRENQHRSYNLVLPCTSHACEKLGSKMI